MSCTTFIKNSSRQTKWTTKIRNQMTKTKKTCGQKLFDVILHRFPNKTLREEFSTLNSTMGVTGFDSKMNCHGSMPSTAVKLVNPGCKKVIGENNYAFAA